jgi:hypothetical protein
VHVKVFGWVLAVLVPASACAQTPPPLPISAQALIHERDGRVQGCGVRLTGGEPAAQVSSWFDVSFNLFRPGFGLAQSIAYEIRRSADGESRPQKVPVRSTWLRASEGSTRVGENTERRDSLVYTLLADDVLALFEALASEQPLTVGIKRWTQRADSVYVARPLLNGDSRERISACLAALAMQ